MLGRSAGQSRPGHPASPAAASGGVKKEPIETGRPRGYSPEHYHAPARATPPHAPASYAPYPYAEASKLAYSEGAKLPPTLSGPHTGHTELATHHQKFDFYRATDPSPTYT